MKEITITIGIIIGGIIGVGLGVYAFLGFLSWLFSDPFNWIPNEPIKPYVEPIDFQICRDSGGYPVRSGWNGELKKCNPLPK
jgi:hypothetical protein